MRDYDPAIGRYLQSDPMGLEAGINTYAYAENNPLRYTDVNGLCAGGRCGESLPHVPGGTLADVPRGRNFDGIYPASLDLEG